MRYPGLSCNTMVDEWDFPGRALYDFCIFSSIQNSTKLLHFQRPVTCFRFSILTGFCVFIKLNISMRIGVVFHQSAGQKYNNNFVLAATSHH